MFGRLETCASFGLVGGGSGVNYREKIVANLYWKSLGCVQLKVAYLYSWRLVYGVGDKKIVLQPMCKG